MTYEKFGHLIMSDDGSGAGLGIPTIMIHHDDGQFIEKYATNDLTSVQLNIQFKLSDTQPDRKDKKKADLTIWYTSGDRKSMHLLKNFNDYIVSIQKYVNF